MARMPIEERRAKLIDAAVEIITSSGVVAATTRAIAAQAGMPLASFHYAFESHAALMREVVTRLLNEEADDVMALLQPGATLPQSVELGLNEFVNRLVRDSSRQQAVNELLYSSLRIPELRELARHGTDEGRRAVVRLLKAHAERTGVKYTVDEAAIAAHVLVLTDGIAQACATGGEGSEPMLRDAIPAMAAAFETYMA